MRFLNIYILLFFFLGAGLSACTKKVEGRSKSEEDLVIPVAVENAVPTTITEEIYLAGDVHADVEVRVLSLVPDRILKLEFEEGDKVKKGQLLATVKSGTLYSAVRGARAGIRAAKTQVKISKIELERTEKLRETGTVSIANLQRAQAQYNSAKAQLAQAEAMLSQSYSNVSNVNIRAPVSGIIGQKFLNEGDVAGPSVPLCTIVQLDPVRIKATVTEFDLVKLKKGQSAVISLPAYPDRKWTGTVDYLSPVLDRATRSALATILVDNKDHLMRPGMFADVVVQTGVRENVITVPARAVRRRVLTSGDVEYSVFLADRDTARMKTVEIGIRKDDRIEIRKGLNQGDKIIVLGNHRLKDGTRIKIGKNPLEKSVTQAQSPKASEPSPDDGPETNAVSESPGSQDIEVQDNEEPSSTSSPDEPKTEK